MTWPGLTEHSRLLSTAERLVGDLRGLHGRLQHSRDIEYAQHNEFANRLRNLADYLDSAILLTRTDIYAPAFANLRTALEHILIDQLTFLGQRYIRIMVGVNATTWREWQQQRDSGAGFTSVLDWRRKRDVVEITYEGLRSEPDANGKFYILSPYYFLLKEYQPYFGPPSAQAQFENGLGDEEAQRSFAEENELIYHAYLNWPSIKRNVLSNNFVDEETLARIDVHYRFLSAFLHPISDMTEIIYGRNPSDVPSYDHYSSELALLYTIAFAVIEIRNFYKMTQQYPSIDISGWQRTDNFCDAAWDEISYLWFPGHRPHQYDRIQEANRRAFINFRTADASTRQVSNPNSIPDDEIRYYRDPIRRLISMHSGFVEVFTGLQFSSPWPRNDARFR